MGTESKGTLSQLWERLNEPVSLGFLDMRLDFGMLDAELPLPNGRKYKSPRLRYQRQRQTQRQLKRDVHIKGQETTPASFMLEGRIRVGKMSQFAIGSEDFTITGDTWIVGEVALNSYAKVKGVFRNGGERVATSVIISR